MLLPQLGKMIVAIYFLILAFASFYSKNGMILDGKISHEIRDALYFSIVTWTTLGYGDIQPTDASKMMAASEALIGVISMPILLASMLYMLSKKTKNIRANQPSEDVRQPIDDSSELK
jgi:hypothetical protein